MFQHMLVCKYVLFLQALGCADESCTQDPPTGLQEGPKRIAIQETAAIHAALAADGAVILTGISGVSVADGTWEAKAAALPSLTFPGRLVSKIPKVQGIHLEHAHLRQNLTSSPFDLVGKPLLPHTDGYIYGEFLPDYIAFVVESQSDSGGQNYVVDGKRVLRRLCDGDRDDSDESETCAMAAMAQTLAVDQTERSPPGFVNGQEFRGPLVQRQRHAMHRLRFHRQTSVLACKDAADTVDENGRLGTDLRPYQSLWALSEPEGHQAHKVQDMLKTVDAAVQQEAAQAYRFTVHEGEALLIDNYRMLHGREGYKGRTERKLWRVWFWTNESSGIPRGMPELGSVLDADELNQI
ncbi:tas [Symbiodinium natans]|uniref:Tas protein n=1 Tax=Symbiodinium natans TaxID=878477 RepID=A0A812R2M1_9DINO|nr:tas [Symbiodinium natans]